MMATTAPRRKGMTVDEMDQNGLQLVFRDVILRHTTMVARAMPRRRGNEVIPRVWQTGLTTADG